MTHLRLVAPNLSCRALVFFLALILALGLTAGSAMAQPATPFSPMPMPGGNGNSNQIGQTQGADVVNINDTDQKRIRENYWKRFPFAKHARDEDRMETFRAAVMPTEVPSGGIGDFFGDLWDGWFGGGDSQAGGGQQGGGQQGGGQQGGQQGSGGNNPTRLLESLPTDENPEEVTEEITAYPFFIKFCNDDPYQGVCYWQFGEAVDHPRHYRDLELFDNVLTTFGYPVSDTQFQIIQRENFQRLLELLYDPERIMWMATNTSQIQGASAANSLAGVSEEAWNQAVDFILNGAEGTGTLINVANEAAGTPTAPSPPWKDLTHAIWMVQRMYKECFVPMAILFLLPGAVISQAKATVSRGFDLGGGEAFEGIIRSVMAVFLIPGTQVIVSYSIDVGNSMADSVKDWIDVQAILDWSHELTYNVDPHENHINAIVPPRGGQGAFGSGAQAGGAQGGNAAGNTTGGAGGGSGSGGGGGFQSTVVGIAGWFGLGGVAQSFFNAYNSLMNFFETLFGFLGEGLGANIPEADTTQEEQLALSQVMQVMFNGSTYGMSLMLIVLTSFQVVYICYLFLLGPISAAFFAWPEMNSEQKLFRSVWGNWVQAVIMVSLWRFYWCVGLAIMTQRLVYMQQLGGLNSLQWEVATFACLEALMIWSSMNPFTFDPAKAYEGTQSIQSAGSAIAQGAGGGGGGAGGAGGAPGGSGGGTPGAQGDQGGTGQGTGTDSGTGQSDNQSNVQVTDNSGPSGSGAGSVDDGGSADDGGGSGSADGGGGGSGSETESQSPDHEAPPMSDQGGGGDGSGGSGEAQAAQGEAPPIDGSGDVAGQAGSGASDAMQAAMASLGDSAEVTPMPSDGPPVDTSPSGGGGVEGGDASKAAVNDNMSGSEVSQALGSQSPAGGDGGGSGGGASEISVNLEGGQGQEDSGDSGDSSPPPPADFNVPPPPEGD